MSLSANRPSIDLSIFVLIGGLLLSFTVMAFSEHVLIWDGSWFLFSSLSTGQPSIAHDRIYLVPFYWPHLLAAQLGCGVGVCTILFGLGTNLLTASTIALCLWVSRRNLVLVAGIIAGPVIGCLPGQIQTVYETALVGQVGALLMVMIAAASPRLLLLGFFLYGPFLFFAHPASVLVFAALAILSAVRATRGDNRMLFLSLFILQIAVAGIRFMVGLDTYEKSEMTPEVTWLHFRLGVLGWPAVFVLLGWAALAAAVVLPSMEARRAHPIRLAAVLPPALSIAFLACALLWALDVRNLIHADTFRRFALFFAIAPAGLCSLVEIVAPGRFSFPGGRLQPALRITFAIALFGSLAALQIQAWSYRGLLDHLRRDLASQAAILSTDDLSWTFMTPLRGWFLPFTSVLVQGREPRSLLVPAKGTAPQRLIDWQVAPDKTLYPSGENRYFRLDRLEDLVSARAWRVTTSESEFGIERVKETEVVWVAHRFVQHYAATRAGNRRKLVVSFRATSLFPNATVTISLRAQGTTAFNSLILATAEGAWTEAPLYRAEFTIPSDLGSFELAFETQQEPTEIGPHDTRRAVFLLREILLHDPPPFQ